MCPAQPCVGRSPSMPARTQVSLQRPAIHFTLRTMVFQTPSPPQRTKTLLAPGGGQHGVGTSPHLSAPAKRHPCGTRGIIQDVVPARNTHNLPEHTRTTPSSTLRWRVCSPIRQLWRLKSSRQTPVTFPWRTALPALAQMAGFDYIYPVCAHQSVFYLLPSPGTPRRTKPPRPCAAAWSGVV